MLLCDTVDDIHTSNTKYVIENDELFSGKPIDITKIEQIEENDESLFIINIYIWDLDIEKQSIFNIYFNGYEFILERYIDVTMVWKNSTSYDLSDVNFKVSYNIIENDILTIEIDNSLKLFELNKNINISTYTKNIIATRKYAFDFYPNIKYEGINYDELQDGCNLPSVPIVYYLIMLAIFPAIIIVVFVLRYIRINKNNKYKEINKKR